MVPVQFQVSTSMGIDEKIAILVTIGKSLLVVLPIAPGGAIGHLKKGAPPREPTTIMDASGGTTAVFGTIAATLQP